MNFIYFLIALLAFSIIIIWHELGHFLVAKMNDVKINEFSVGFGPKILSKKKGEIQYSLRTIPFGGYVQMYGEIGEETEDSRAFKNKKPIQRLAITAAGPIMNLILAVIFFAIIGGVRGIPVPIVGEIEINTPAYEAGIKKGDQITKVDGEDILSWNDFMKKINEKKDNIMNLTILRNNEEKNIKIKPIKVVEENRYKIGIGATVKKLNFFESIGYGFSETGNLFKETFVFLGNMIKGKIASSDVGGPISVLRLSTKAAQNGILTLIWLCGYISVQLAIFNLIPLPALDGGWILLSFLEMITGKKFNEKIVGNIFYIGFILLFALLILVTIKDIIHPLRF